MVNELEKKFEKDMINIYWEAKRELNYTAARFMQLVLEKGGLRAAKQLITKDKGTSGFTTLYDMGRLDLSVEAHVLKPEYTVYILKKNREYAEKDLRNMDIKDEEMVENL